MAVKLGKEDALAPGFELKRDEADGWYNLTVCGHHQSCGKSPRDLIEVSWFIFRRHDKRRWSANA